MLLVGPVGTGKTSVAQAALSKLDSTQYSLLTINLSAQVGGAVMGVGSVMGEGSVMGVGSVIMGEGSPKEARWCYLSLPVTALRWCSHRQQ